jgi:hypothetical protein
MAINHPDYSNLRVKPSDLIHKHRPRPELNAEICGCCPACGEFVDIKGFDGNVGANCPACDQFVNKLLPLGES